eukprot:scaffold124246_cov35-Tisochrysis_lutea.AAC.3
MERRPVCEIGFYTTVSIPRVVGAPSRYLAPRPLHDLDHMLLYPQGVPRGHVEGFPLGQTLASLRGDAPWLLLWR